MKFTLEIALGNDASQSADDVAHMLIKVANKLLNEEAEQLMPKQFRNIKDLNGNTVGLWQVKETEDVV